MNISEKYDVGKYNDWYNKTFQKKINIENEVEILINDIVKVLLSNIKITNDENSIWSFFQTFINDVALKVQLDNDDLTFDILPEVTNYNPTEFRSLFGKPTNSIINKMWRKNNFERGMDYIELSNIKDKMKDLIRFAIRTNSLKNSEILAHKFNSIIQLKDDPTYKEYWDKIIESIWVDTEMKTSTGYFAYHIYFKLKVGVIVEMQIYSILSDSWKKLSHKIYEAVRDEINVKYNFNDVHSRIISIGHLLYLADCELYNLEQELEKD